MYYDIQPVEWSAKTRMDEDQRKAALRRLAKSVAQPRTNGLQSRIRRLFETLRQPRSEATTGNMTSQQPAHHAAH